MKVAISKTEEIEHINQFLNECSWLKDELSHYDLEDVDFTNFELLKDFNKKDPAEFLGSVVNEIKALYYEKALMNLITLIDHCADKTLDYLDFNKEIKAGQEAVDFLKEFNECFSSESEIEAYKQKAKLILDKIPVEEEGSEPDQGASN